MSKSVNIADLKAHLSEHLRTVRAGDELIVKDRNTPVARIVPYVPTAEELEDDDVDDLVLTPAKRPWFEVYDLPPLPYLGIPWEKVMEILAEEKQSHR